MISLRIVTRDANPDLARAAVEAVSHWRYAPGSVNGESVEFTGRVTVSFALGN